MRTWFASWTDFVKHTVHEGHNLESELLENIPGL